MKPIRKAKYSALVLQSEVWTGKRTKIVALATFVTLSVFLLKIFQTRQFEIWEMYSFSIVMAVITYFWLFGVLDFTVNKRTLLVILPQSSIFVFATILFVQLFFLMKLERIYEALLILLVLGFLFIGAYVSFLTANVFAVSSYGKIPLERVARTTSYVLSALVIYFLSFAILASSWHIVILLLELMAVYMVVLWIHLSHLEFSEKLLRGGVLLSSWSVFVMTVALLPITNRQELIAFVPTMVALSTINMVTAINEKKPFWGNFLWYFMSNCFLIWLCITV